MLELGHQHPFGSWVITIDRVQKLDSVFSNTLRVLWQPEEYDNLRHAKHVQELNAVLLAPNHDGIRRLREAAQRGVGLFANPVKRHL